MTRRTRNLTVALPPPVRAWVNTNAAAAGIPPADWVATRIADWVGTDAASVNARLARTAAAREWRGVGASHEFAAEMLGYDRRRQRLTTDPAQDRAKAMRRVLRARRRPSPN